MGHIFYRSEGCNYYGSKCEGHNYGRKKATVPFQLEIMAPAEHAGEGESGRAP